VSELVTYDEAVEFVGDETVVREARMRQWINGLSAFIRRYIGGPLETTGYTEYLDGNGETSIRLSYRPVLALDTVTVDGTEVDGSDLVFYADGELYNVNGFTSGRKNVVATYSAGYGANVPEDMQLAVLLILDQAHQQSLLQQATRGEYAYVFSPTRWPKDAREIVDSYRRKL
jgi:hypothetical protein